MYTNQNVCLCMTRGNTYIATCCTLATNNGRGRGSPETGSLSGTDEELYSIAPDPSPRNAQISRHSNHPDRIEARLEADGHQTWGFVIYRTTYKSEADWAEFLRRLRLWTEDSMEFYNGKDILDLMTWTLFDDRSLFDGADSAAIRRHFIQWAENAVQSEQRQPGNDAPVSMGLSPRYRYCVQVDADALKSVVHDTLPPLEYDQYNRGWVRLIEKKWILASENPVFAGRKLDPAVYEPIEGVTEDDVGWVRCPYASVMTEYYVLFEDPNQYTVNRRRPPTVIGWPWK